MYARTPIYVEDRLAEGGRTVHLDLEVSHKNENLERRNFGGYATPRVTAVSAPMTVWFAASVTWLL